MIFFTKKTSTLFYFLRRLFNTFIGRPLEPEHLEDEYSMTIIYVSWTQKNYTILQTD